MPGKVVVLAFSALVLIGCGSEPSSSLKSDVTLCVDAQMKAASYLAEGPNPLSTQEKEELEAYERAEAYMKCLHGPADD